MESGRLDEYGLPGGNHCAAIFGTSLLAFSVVGNFYQVICKRSLEKRELPQYGRFNRGAKIKAKKAIYLFP